MTKDDMRKELAKATAIVTSWPTWKQHILEDSFKPENSTCRIPVQSSEVRESTESRQQPEKQ